MIRKTITILSLIGLLLSVGLWGMTSFLTVSYDDVVGRYASAAQGAVWLGNDLGYAGPGWYTADIAFDWQDPVNGFEWWPLFANDKAGFQIIIPFWMPALVCMSALLWGYLPLHRRRKRKKLGLCVKCGYDLRGSSERCPECGQEFEKQ